MKKFTLFLLILTLSGCVVGKISHDREKLYESSVVCEPGENSHNCIEGARI